MNTQRIWDECLIAAWRSDGAVLYAVNEWQRITGLSFEEHQLSLRRVPYPGYPWKIRVRVFAAQHLDKISDRMWDQPPERDAALIDKLQTSTYTTQRAVIQSEAVRELQSERRRLNKNRATMALDIHNHSDRNHNTDWGVTKASNRRVGGRR